MSVGEPIERGNDTTQDSNAKSMRVQSTPDAEGDDKDGEGDVHEPASLHSHQESQGAGTDVEKGIAQPSTDLVQDSSDAENVVWWDGDDDPHNPYNWPSWIKVLNCVLISALTFVTPLASCTSNTLPPHEVAHKC